MKNIRHEIKVILDEVRLGQAQAWMNRSTQFQEVHQVRTVNSVYFDDVNYSALRDNLMGLAHRQKLRLRWYAESAENNYVSPKIEVKSRIGRVGNKKAVPLESVDSDLLAVPYSSLFAEIENRLKTDHELPLGRFYLPVIHVSYDRTYFEAPNGVRLTIDRNINFYDPNQGGSPITSLAHRYNRVIMEIKFTPEQRDHTVKLLSKSELTPQRHSKYVAGLASFGRATYI